MGWPYERGMNLERKRVLVVGGSSGIGFATARLALERGAEVVLASRSREKLASAARDLGDRVRTVAVDVGREEDVGRLFAEVTEIDHIVTTAVDAAYQPVQQLDLTAARKVVDSKLVGALLLAKHGAPRVRPGGSLTFTAGIASERPGANGSVVAAVNGALGALARALSLELAPVRVNVVSPGWVDTPVWDSIAGAGKADVFAKMAARLPVGRVGRPEDLAHAIVFLMENEFSTGTVLHVDGGHRLV
jgi:NAD(P)-dependent dehydrogenase (short-subunit alcohol dehydrogenase family)